MKKLLAFTLGANHPSSRLRIAAYENYFSRHGWDLRLHHFDSGMGKSSPRSGSSLKRARLRLRRAWQTARAMKALRKLPSDEPIIISRELPVSVRTFLNAPNPMILDIDDALYLGCGRDRLLELCKRAQVVVCGNKTISAELSKFSRRCVVIPTAVDANLYRVRKDYKLNGPLRLGWLGSSMSIEQTLLPFINVLVEIRRQLPFELVVISDEPPHFLPDIKWASFLKWSPAVEKSIEEQMDVGLMPLQDNLYQQAKCGAKLLQYFAAGLPVIASPVGVNRELVTDGVTGFLASSPQDWRRAIHQLSGQENLRAEFGRAGHGFVVKNFSVARWANEWVALLDEIVGQPN